jgi:predicted nucleotidyltransferase
MRQHPYKETNNVAGGVCRQIKAVGERVAQEDPEDLLALQQIEQALDRAWSTAVTGLRATGYTDRDIGKVLGGITKQSVAERWPRESDVTSQRRSSDRQTLSAVGPEQHDRELVEEAS